MKKKLAGILSLLMILSIFMSFFTINTSAAWLSPLAERGDVSNNGRLEAMDARMVLRVSAKLVRLYPPSKWPKDKVYGDVDGDGKITARDARLILRRSANLPDYMNPKYKNDAEIFLSGKYHLIGKMESSGELVDWNIAISGKDLYTEMVLDGRKIAILMLNEKLYMLNIRNRTYCELSSNFFDELGLEVGDFNFDFPSFSDAVLVGSEEVNVGGRNLTMLKYDVGDGSLIHFYLDGTDLEIIETYFEDTLASTIYVDSISSDLSGVLSIPINFAKLPFELFILTLM